MKRFILLLSICCLIGSSSWLSGSDTKCDGAVFDGEAREDAKTSIGTQPAEGMSIVDFMDNFSGNPTLDDDSPRSAIEERNVTVTAWLYTYSREGDEDFHLILGSSNTITGCKFISAEVSGLPKSSTSKDYDKLKKARDQFETLILGGEDYCSGFTKKLIKNPIQVTVTGSVFYDTHHASGGSGFKDKKTGIEYKSKTPWEIHPVTSIVKAGDGM